jgi:hypothetical protein
MEAEFVSLNQIEEMRQKYMEQMLHKDWKLEKQKNCFDDEIEKAKRTIDDQQTLIDEQQTHIDDQQKRINDQQKDLDARGKEKASLQFDFDELKKHFERTRTYYEMVQQNMSDNAQKEVKQLKEHNQSLVAEIQRLKNQLANK